MGRTQPVLIYSSSLAILMAFLSLIQSFFGVPRLFFFGLPLGVSAFLFGVGSFVYLEQKKPTLNALASQNRLQSLDALGGLFGCVAIPALVILFFTASPGSSDPGPVFASRDKYMFEDKQHHRFEVSRLRFILSHGSFSLGWHSGVIFVSAAALKRALGGRDIGRDSAT